MYQSIASGLALVAASVSVSTAHAQVRSVGSEYRPVGTIGGDQMKSSLGMNDSRGLLVWQDNADGNGLGIRGRWLSSQGVGTLEAFSINQEVVGNQELPAVAPLTGGSFFIAWQSVQPSGQEIRGRILGKDGVFASDELKISGSGSHRNVAVAALKGGGVVVSWVSNSPSGDMDDVMVATVGADGSIIGAPQVANIVRLGNQKDVAVAASSDGGFIVAYSSDFQFTSTRILGRRFDAASKAIGGEIAYTDPKNPALTPNLVSTGDGYLLAWSSLDRESDLNRWDIGYVALDSNGLRRGGVGVLPGKRTGSQLNPRLARLSNTVLVAYESEGVDGFGIGIAGQLLSSEGFPIGDEFLVNSVNAGDQVGPVIGAAQDQALVVWSGYGGIANGMDLRAQRFGLDTEKVETPAAPFVNATSSSRLLVSWPPVDGLPVASYELYVDGNLTPVTTVESFVYLSGLPPESRHDVSLSVVLADGRKSAQSLVSSGTTWGEDSNSDGLPDDWQRIHFGADEAKWPDPSADTDGDGKSNREEFLSGTSPVDVASVLKIQIQNTPQGQVISWNAIPGAIYQLQKSSNLTNWVDAGGKRMATGTQESAYLDEISANYYYRIIFLR